MRSPKRAVNHTGVSTIAGVVGVLVSCGLVTVAACSSDDQDSVFIDGGPGASSSGSSTSGGSSGFQQTPTPEAGPTPVCLSKQADAIEGKRPVDIIFAIDNSVSMADETSEVEDQINDNFANIIDASGLDFHVIMLSKHGVHDPPGSPVPTDDRLQCICVKAPLSGTTCTPGPTFPAKPAETGRFIQHNIVINSQDSWCQILKTFNGPDDDGSHPQGWSTFLRPTAFKTFVVITDDRINTSCNPFGSPQPLVFDDKTDDPISGTTAAGTFDSALLAMSSQFGTAAHRNYKWHSIIGVAPYNPSDLTLAYPPDAPINANKCGTTAEAPATGYQALSKLTGGLRYPTCGLDFTTIFKAMADDVIKNSHVSCDYAVPPNPDGGTIDPATAVVEYTASNGGGVTDFGQVANQAACADDKFYIEGDRIKLCDTSCLKVTNDPTAAVKILFGCLPKDTGQK